MQAQGLSILLALDSQTTNKVPRWGGAAGDFSAELWLNQVQMLRTMNKWMEEQTKEACFLSMEGAAATWKQATLRDEGPDALATFTQFKEAFLKRFKKHQQSRFNLWLSSSRHRRRHAWTSKTVEPTASTRRTKRIYPN